MTDRIRTVIVVLDNDYRTDDVQPILNALLMVKGVTSAEIGDVLDPTDYIARHALRHEVYAKLVDAVGDSLMPKKSIP
jgi:hypothetical protein